jgi:hypothetical protein
MGVDILSRCLENYEFSSDDIKFELIGRLAIKETRFRIGLEKADHDLVFTGNGKAIYNFLDSKCFATISRLSEIFGKYDFSNQGPVFEFARFEEANQKVY